MQRHVAEFRSSFRVVPPVKRRLLAEAPTPTRLRFVGSHPGEKPRVGHEPRLALCPRAGG